MLKPKPKFDLKELRAQARQLAEDRKNQECWTCVYGDLMDYKDRNNNNIVYCNMLCQYRRKRTNQLCLFYDIKQK